MHLSDILLAAATLFVGALMFTGQVPPKQAISNIAAWWLKPFGFRVAWLENPDADRVIRNIAWIAVPGLLIWGGVQYLDIQNMLDGPKALLVVGALCLASGLGWHIWTPPRTASAARQESQAPANQPTAPNNNFRPELPKGPVGKECFAEGLKELRGYLAQMRSAVSAEGGVRGSPPEIEKIDAYKSRLETSREVHAKLTGPGEGPFFSSRPDCKAQLKRLFPANTQATWEQFNSALYFYLNGLELSQEMTNNPTRANKNIEPLLTRFVSTLNDLGAVLEEITVRLRATDEVMQ